jgi:hypothetical protein
MAPFKFIPLVLLLLPAVAWAAPAENHVVAVLDAKPIDLPDMGPHALREAVMDAVKAQGGVVVDGGQGLTPGQVAACNTPDCYRKVAETTGATYVLRVDGSYADYRYQLQILIWNRQTDGIVSSDRDRCKLCLADDILRIARNQTAYVIGKAFAGEPATAPGHMSPAPVAGDPHGSVTDPMGFHNPAASQPQPHRWLGWTLGAAGVLAGVTSVLFLVDDKQKIDCGSPPGDTAACAMQRRTTTPAIAFAAGAVGGLVAGTIILVRGHDGGDSAVSLSLNPYPVGLVLGGRL